MLARLGERNLLFSEALQAIYEVNDTTASAWLAVDDQHRHARIAGDLSARGVGPVPAQGTNETVAPRPLSYPPSAPGAGPTDRADGHLERLSLSIAGVVVDLYLSTPLLTEVLETFGPLVAEPTSARVAMHLRAEDGMVHFSSGQRDKWSCARVEFIPLLKAELVDAVLSHADYEVALHAAAVVRKGEAVLLLGAPGAGKSTLSIALSKLGLGVLADDVVFLDRGGLVSGMPMPFTVKSGAWPVLRIRPGIGERRPYRRSDGQEVCYLPYAFERPRQGLRIGAVLILDRQEGAAADAKEVDRVTALGALIGEGSTRNEELSSNGFKALVDGLAGARCRRLVYSDCHEAALLVCGLD